MYFYLDRGMIFPKPTTLHQSTKSPMKEFTILMHVHLFEKAKTTTKILREEGWKTNQNPSLEKRRGLEMEVLKTLVLDEYQSCYYKPIIVMIQLLLEEEKRVSMFLDCATLLASILKKNF